MSFIIYLYYILLPTNYALHCIFYSLIRLRQNLPNKILPFPSLSTWLSVHCVHNSPYKDLCKHQLTNIVNISRTSTIREHFSNVNNMLPRNQTFPHSIVQLICFVSIYCDCVILKQQGNGDAIFCHTSD